MNWGGEALWEAVAPRLPGFTVEVLPEVDSTNSELMRRARAGQRDPVLLVAERQTAGRGRLGRQWVGGPGHSLAMSLGLVLAPADWSGLSLVVGVAVAESLHGRISLKWPNDLWVEGRKLGGILIETASFGAGSGDERYAVIGIGVNIEAPAVEGVSVPPAGLRELIPGIDAPAALARIAGPLVDAVHAFEQFGYAAFQARFAARDLLLDREVVLSDGTAGTAHGTDATGGLLVHTAAGMVAVTSAEVSVRPAS